MTRDLRIILPPRAGTGLRHVIEAGAERTLCGRTGDFWFLETKRFDANTVGCKRCRAALKGSKDGHG